MVGSIGRIDKLEHVPFAHASAGDVGFFWGLQKKHRRQAITVISKPDILLVATLMSTSVQKRNLLASCSVKTKKQSIRAAKDVGRGGLGVALAKLCARAQQGAQIDAFDSEGRADWEALR